MCHTIFLVGLNGVEDIPRPLGYRGLWTEVSKSYGNSIVCLRDATCIKIKQERCFVIFLSRFGGREIGQG